MTHGADMQDKASVTLREAAENVVAAQFDERLHCAIERLEAAISVEKAPAVEKLEGDVVYLQMALDAAREDHDRLQKEIETAREDALEEAAKVANRKWQEYQGPFGSQAASTCAYEIEVDIRRLKDKEVAG